MNEPDVEVLFVEDDQQYRKYTAELIKDKSRSIFGVPVDRLKLCTVGNMEDARDRLVAHPGGYGLIILDLLIFRTRQEEEAHHREGRPLHMTGAWEDLPGMHLLADVRKWQPDACVVVMTSYAYENHLMNAVETLRSWNVGDFLPKEIPWDDMQLRLRVALQRALEGRNNDERLRKMRVLSREHARSRLGRVLWEDFSCLLSSLATGMQNVADDIEIGGGEQDERAPEKLRDLAASSRAGLSRLAAAIPQGSDSREPVDVSKLIGDLRDALELPVYGLQLPAAEVTTYRDDLGVALLEVFYNALEAMDRQPEPKHRKLEIELTSNSENRNITVRIRDNGGGFPDEVLATAGGYGPEAPKKPLGLHIVHRMMEHLGGSAALSNWSGEEGRGGEVVLTIPDLK